MVTIEVKNSLGKKDLIRIVKNEKTESLKSSLFFHIIFDTLLLGRHIALDALIVLLSVLRQLN